MSSISKQGNRYYYRYRDTAGKQHCISLYTSNLSVATRRSKQYDNEVEQYGAIRRQALNLKAVFEKWLIDRASQKTTTRRKMFTYLFEALKPLFEKKIHLIRREDIEGILDSKISYSHRSKILSLYRSIVSYAIENGWMHFDCTKGLYLKNEDAGIRSQKDFLTIDNLIRVLNYAKERFPQYEPMFRLSYYTGMRLGEVRLLEWEDVNFETSRIYLPLEKVKVRMGQVVMLNSKAVELLKGLDRTSDFVFVNPDTNRPYSDRHPAKIVKKILKALRIYNKGITGHLFRKSFISHLIQNGARPKEVQELARHKDIRTTMNVYARLSPEFLRGALDKLPTID